jgi:hypothetical protein
MRTGGGGFKLSQLTLEIFLDTSSNAYLLMNVGLEQNEHDLSRVEDIKVVRSIVSNADASQYRDMLGLKPGAGRHAGRLILLDVAVIHIIAKHQEVRDYRVRDQYARALVCVCVCVAREK